MSKFRDRSSSAELFLHTVCFPELSYLQQGFEQGLASLAVADGTAQLAKLCGLRLQALLVRVCPCGQWQDDQPLHSPGPLGSEQEVKKVSTLSTS